MTPGRVQVPLPTFAVVALMREDAETVRRFVGFYRKAGASRIDIYFDGSADHLGGLDLEGVGLTECTDDYWIRHHGRRPESVEEAQALVYAEAARRMVTDWLLVVDADEFVVGAPLRPLLARVPDRVMSLKLRNAEAVWGPGDDPAAAFGSTHFRRPMRRAAGRLATRIVYGASLAGSMRNGVMGHSDGKHLLRRGTPVTSVRLHDSFVGPTAIGQWAHRILPLQGRRIFVAHYDAISFERWCEKWRRRFSGERPAARMGARRSRQMQEVETALARGPEAALALFRRYYGLTRAQRAFLWSLGRIDRMEVFGRDRDPG